MNTGADWLLERKIHSLQALQVPLRLKLWNGRSFDLGPDPQVGISILKPAAIRHFLFPDLDGLSQAYVEGEIDVEGSVRTAIQIAASMSSHSGLKMSGLNLPKLRPRTKKSDKKSISYHYDVSNEFYRLWLDRNMVYSCAYFKNETEDLDRAQENKLDHICRKLMLQPGDRFLDVGCGWGGLMIWAARHYGVKALGITISREQHKAVEDRIREEGLQGRCEVKLMDYRDLRSEGAFDKIASIGMFEHVGLKNLPRYFHLVQSSLRDGGRLLNHGITSNDFASATKNHGGGRFIDRYVFPNGELPDVSLAIQRMEEQHLEAVDVESLRPHYAKTLSLWYDRFLEKSAAARELIGEKRYRIWNVYLPGCAYAFERGWVSIYQVISVKNARRALDLGPLTRDYIYSEFQESARA